MARSYHDPYSSRTDRLDRYSARRPQPKVRRASTRQAVVARAMREVTR